MCELLYDVLLFKSVELLDNVLLFKTRSFIAGEGAGLDRGGGTLQVVKRFPQIKIKRFPQVKMSEGGHKNAQVGPCINF